MEEMPKSKANAAKNEIKYKGRWKGRVERESKADDDAETMKEEELEPKRAEITAVETEIQTRMTTRLTELRAELKKKGIDATTYKGFAKTATEDNRPDVIELANLQRYLTTIRFIESGDENKDSTVLNENTALVDLEKISTEMNNPGRKSSLAVTFMNAYGKDDSSRITKYKSDIIDAHLGT
jgi:hypothetical protein